MRSLPNPDSARQAGKRSLSRRSFVLGSAALAALCSPRLVAVTASRHRLSGYPFTLGVASGDPAPDGFVIWTRLAPQPLETGGGMPEGPFEVSWQVAEDEAMSRVVQSGTATAVAEWAHTVHVEVEGLRPDRWYWYRFRAAGELSPVGRSRTFPRPGELPGNLRFAFASCQHYEHGYYTAYEHLAREDVDLIAHLGDYIYEYGERELQPNATEFRRDRRHLGPEILSLDDYRNRYALYKTDPALQAAHALAPWIVTWDDHEVSNNYAGVIPQFRGTMAMADFVRRRTAAYRAYYEHLPLRRSARPAGPALRLHRRLAFGRLALFHVLDTRQYRSDQPGTEASGPSTPGDDRFAPAATMLGTEQREWLFDGLARSPTTWNVLAQQVMFACVDRAPGPDVTHSLDQWPGYEAERRRLLRHLRERRVANPVVLTGDIHSNWANELVLDFDEFDGASAAVEFVGTSISSGGDGADAPGHLGQLLAENPFVKFHNTERGYVKCHVTPREWRTDFRTVPYVRRRGAPLQTRASLVVEAGRPRIQPA